MAKPQTVRADHSGYVPPEKGPGSETLWPWAERDERLKPWFLFPVVSQPRMNDEFMNGARSNFGLLLRIHPLPTSAPAVTMLEGTTCNTPIVDLRGGVGG